MALSQDDAIELIRRRHPEWVEHQKRWRWLQDSLEGGERYRHADYFRGPFDPPAGPWYAYGFDTQTGEGFPFSFGQIVERNLIPHLSEMSPQNRDLYALRLHRTPVPALVSRVVRKYLSRIYARPVARKGPPELTKGWWVDTDGCGQLVNLWFRKTVGPLLLTLGQLDLVFAHPESPDGVLVTTKAQAKKLGLDGVVAGYVLPENLVWWRVDRRGRYEECLVYERGEDGGVTWRHWTPEGCDVYSAGGEHAAGLSYAYDYGRPPLVRVFDDRKLRCRNVGQSRIEVIAELQKSIYNRKSELILGDITQSHAVLQGPEEFMEADAKVPLGPGGSLPKKRVGDRHEGWDYIVPPQLGMAEVRTHVQDDQDEVLADAALLKPAGTTDGKTVGQSGVSKSFDAREGNDVLSEVAATLRDAEVAAAGMALLVATDGHATEADLAAIAVDYPREYDLFTANDLAVVLADIQALVTAAGGLPETEAEVLKRLITVLLPGLDEPRMGELHAEIVEAVNSGAARRDGEREAGGAADGADSTEDPAIGLPPDASQQVSAANAINSPGTD